MRATGIKSRTGIMYLCLLLGFAACKQETAQVVQPPALDMAALADFDSEHTGFGQVLLKLHLLNTRADILKYGIHTPEEHQERLYYYRTHFKDDVFLLSGADTIPCYDLRAERMYMDLPYMNFILTFERPMSDGDKLLIQDIVYTQQTAILNIDPIMQ